MSLTDDAILAIKAMIASGDLKPGDRLPKEADLSASLGISRNSLREAVKALEVMRILDVRRGDGTYVTSLDPSLLMEAVSFIVEFHNDSSVLEELEVRRILEAAATEMASRNATAEDVEELYRLAEPVESLDEMMAADIRFHGKIARLSGNGYLASLLDSLSSATLRARTWRGVVQADAVDRTIAEHRSIVDAIASGNPEVAKSMAVLHVSNLERWLREL